MKNSRITITDGLDPAQYAEAGIVDLMDMDACVSMLESMFHPNGLSCPSCGSSERSSHGRTIAHRVHRFRCSDCGRIYTVTSCTIFSGTNLDPRRIVLLLFLLGHGIGHRTIANIIRIPVDRVRAHAARISLYGATNIDAAA